MLTGSDAECQFRALIEVLAPFNTISGRLVHHGQEFTSLVEARSAAEDIATAAGHAIAV